MPKTNLQQKTRNGHNLMTMASAMQKAIRRGDVKLASYAAMEMFGEYWSYMWSVPRHAKQGANDTL